MYNAKLLREILDAQYEMVCRFSRDGTILFVNRAYADTLSKAPAELTGRSLWNFVSAEDRSFVEEQIARLSPENRIVTIENRFDTPAGPRWVTWYNTALTFDADGNWIEAQSSGFDITERKALEEQRQLLLDELNHRVRNTLMVVQGMAYQSFKNENVPPEPLAAFNARLHALSAAHTALSRSNWTGAAIEEVVRRGLAFCGQDEGRLTVGGPEFTLRPNAAVALVLILHELATNAVKYGALSNLDGRIDLNWAVAAGGDGGNRLTLTWTESGGPAIVAPTRHGFGTRLITTSVRQQLGGEVTMSYPPEGLVCAMSMPLKAVQS